jgi:intracellular septation protein A
VSGRRRLALVGVEVLAPVVVYYVARALEVAPVPALLLGAVWPAVRVLAALVRRRRVDRLALLVLALVVATAAASVPSGSPELLLARGSVVTAVLGVVVLGSLTRPRPVMFTVGRAVLEGAGHDPAPWDARFAAHASFRRLWRTITALWGAGLLLDAVLGVVLAFRLPVDMVPVSTTVGWVLLVVVLQVATQVLLRRPRHRGLVFG